MGKTTTITSLLQGWTKFELTWLAISTAVIIAVSVTTNSSWLSFVSSIAGILCVVFAAKGKIATYYAGIIQAGTYAYISYTYALYGEAMLNALFYFPLQFVGLWLWYKHSKKKNEAKQGEDVYAKRLNAKQWLILIPIIIVAVVAYAFVLSGLNAQQVRLDSAAVILSIVAQILMLLRFAEQWVLWIAVNVLSITLWTVTLIQNPEGPNGQGADWSLVAMWSAFLVNSIYGYINWLKLAKKDQQATNQVTQN